MGRIFLRDRFNTLPLLGPGGLLGGPRCRRLCPALEYLEKRELLTSTITGQVFQDFNANGKFDTTATLANAAPGGGRSAWRWTRGWRG
jgi:hypothetical protein